MIKLTAAAEKLDAEVKAAEQKYHDGVMYWTQLCASRSINANLPDTLSHHLMQHGLSVADSRVITPVFDNCPPWMSNPQWNIDNYVEWMQDPASRLKWLNEHPDASHPTGFNIAFKIEKD